MFGMVTSHASWLMLWQILESGCPGCATVPMLTGSGDIINYFQCSHSQAARALIGLPVVTKFSIVTYYTPCENLDLQHVGLLYT